MSAQQGGALRALLSRKAGPRDLPLTSELPADAAASGCASASMLLARCSSDQASPIGEYGLPRINGGYDACWGIRVS